MKGTLVSFDFVKDSNGDYKYLEMNTDTGIPDGYLQDYNSWDGFIELLSGSSINTIEVVYKPLVSNNLVENLSQSLHESASFITSFVKHEEDLDTIYPIAPDDSETKFVLRIAYDENAILDSMYCKNGINSFDLFNQNNDSDSAVPVYYSSSQVYVDTMNSASLNESNFPDLVKKPLSNPRQDVRFIKLNPFISDGIEYTSSEYDLNRIQAYVTNYDEGFYHTSYVTNNDVVVDGVAQSVRLYSIVYGGSLSTIHLGLYNLQSTFGLPTELSTTDVIEGGATVLNMKHNFEFSTATSKEISTGFTGIYETENFVSQSGEIVSIEALTTSSLMKSFHIEGLPDTDDESIYRLWKVSGKSIPSGSYETSSLLVSKFSSQLTNPNLIEFKFDGETEYRYVHPALSILAYESSSDEIKFLPAKYLTHEDHYTFDENSNLLRFSEVNDVLLNKTTGSLYMVDLEPRDILLAEGSSISGFGYFIHNAKSCFVGGTEITLFNRDVKNIEDIQDGDEVLSYNNETEEFESSIVGSVSSHEVSEVIRLTINNEDVIICTPEHPFYVSGMGYQMAKNLEFGYEVLNNSGEYSFISTIEYIKENHIVYNLHNVGKNENFFANSILVHNKPQY